MQCHVAPHTYHLSIHMYTKLPNQLTLEGLEDVLPRLLQECHEQAVRHPPVRGEDALEAVCSFVVFLLCWVVG